MKKVDRDKNTVLLADGNAISYDKLVLATGSSPIVLPIPGIEKVNVFVAEKDVPYLKNMLAAVSTVKDIVIIGGGFIGIEFAEESKKNPDCNVTIVEMLPHCLQLTFDEEFCAEAEKLIAEMGIKLLANSKVEATHSVCGLPGGVSKAITEDERRDFEEKSKSIVEFSKLSLKFFDDVVLKNKEYVDLILSDMYTLKSYYMGLVDANNKVNFYEGDVRVVDSDGKEFAKFKPADYLSHIAEHVEPWTYVKFPFLKKIGWKGLLEDKDSGVYRVAPLARLNAADGMAMPLAQAEYERMYQTLGGKPVHHTLAMHWARLIEVQYAAERLLELCQDPEITDPNVRTIPTATPDEGVGIIEAPRGTLIHHYQTDEYGTVKKVNLIVATGNNNAAMCMSIKKVAQALIQKGKEATGGILNMIELAYRAYDPCIACATHSLPGQLPLEVVIYDAKGKEVKRLSQFLS